MSEKSNTLDLLSLEERLRRHVIALASTPREPGSREHQAAQEYIGKALIAAGFHVDILADSAEGFACTNLVTRPLPADDQLPLLIVGAHYDSVHGSPGADDNASAVATLLELARWVFPVLSGPEALRCRLQLAAYDLEEYGLIGSNLHARQVEAAGLSLYGMISLEMLGYIDQRQGSQRLPVHLAGLYPDVADFIGVCANEDSRELMQDVVEGLKSVAGLPVESLAVPGRGEMVLEVRLSDHSSFWDRGFPALMITDTSFFRNPHYHQVSDVPATLDYPFLAKVTAGVCGAVGGILRTAS
jgi:Zn-dependent M28 family amino/carboxypeptidase